MAMNDINKFGEQVFFILQIICLIMTIILLIEGQNQLKTILHHDCKIQNLIVSLPLE